MYYQYLEYVGKGNYGVFVSYIILLMCMWFLSANICSISCTIAITSASTIYNSHAYTLQEGGSSSPLAVFASPFTALYRVVFQTSGEIEADNILYNSPLHYQVSSYALFLVFVVAVPILFNNFLVS